MEVMNLVRRDRRSLKQGESRMREDAFVGLPRCPVLAGHVTVVRRRGTPCQPIALVVRPHAMKAAAAA